MANVLSLQSLSLQHFRNYSSVRIEITAAPVVLTGHNGAGKTNLLEAVSLLTPGRGLRRARMGELDALPPPAGGRAGVGAGPLARNVEPAPSQPSPLQGEGLNRWTVAASVQGMQGLVKIGTGRDPESVEGDKRIVRIDGKPARSQSELARHVAVVWLTPQMEQLFQEGASASRKFLDRLVYGFDAEHAGRINAYEFAMRERNKLLALGRADAAWLEALEQTMAETGCAIALARLHTVEHINHAVAASPLSFPKAQLGVDGFLETRLAAGASAVDAEDALRAALNDGRRLDAAAGRALAGTHRSELQVMHLGKGMPAASCSTGEQKAMLLSIVLAQARSGARWHGVVPILLLDEVVAHLDAIKRGELFEELLAIGAQAWMTGTDASLFSGLEGSAQFFNVSDGALSQRG